MIPEQVVLPSELTVHGDDGPIDVADQAVAKHDVGDFPVPALTDIG